MSTFRKKGKTCYLEEPLATYTSRIRAIGNSKGVILNNNLIESAGLKQDLDIVIQAGDGVIIITQVNDSGVNRNLASWDKQFKSAIKKGAEVEGDLFEEMGNDFDLKEW